MNLTLDDVADYLDGYHKYGGYAMAICVWHDDHSPSMQVSDRGYRCLSCGAHGSLSKLYEKVSGRVVVREKFNNPAQKVWFDWLERFGSVQNIVKIAHQELVRFPERGEYLKKRKIDSQIKAGKIGLLDSYFTFPIHDEYEQVQGLVARAAPSIQTKTNRYTVSPRCPVKLYVPSWRTVRKAEALYVPYGTLDAWTLHMAGYPSATGISGQELNTHNLDRFRLPIYIIPDKYEEKKALELQCTLGWRGNLLLLDWPENFKDLNQIHMDFGLEKVQELIEIAKRRYIYNE